MSRGLLRQVFMSKNWDLYYMMRGMISQWLCMFQSWCFLFQWEWSSFQYLRIWQRGTSLWWVQILSLSLDWLHVSSSGCGTTLRILTPAILIEIMVSNWLTMKFLFSKLLKTFIVGHFGLISCLLYIADFFGLRLHNCWSSQGHSVLLLRLSRIWWEIF